MAACERLGDEVRLVAGVELVAEVLDVSLDCARSDPELLRALLGREARGDALQHLALAVRQCDEVFLLPRIIQDAVPLLGEVITLSISLVAIALQALERAVPVLDNAPRD